ncbi:MAG: endonuclease [Sphingomonadales bacterium]|nr:endonuclease [Sphingomonadales bacterium]
MRTFLLLSALSLATTAEARPVPPKAEIVRTSASPAAVIASTATVPPGSRLVWLSGATAAPVDPAKPDEFGDTATQTKSILTKMKATLEGMGLGMGDVIKMNVFLVAPQAGGHMDAPGMNAVFKTFFGTPEQPNKPTRTTVQVAALGRPTTLVEIEAVVGKAP